MCLQLSFQDPFTLFLNIYCTLAVWVFLNGILPLRIKVFIIYYKKLSFSDNRLLAVYKIKTVFFLPQSSCLLSVLKFFQVLYK